jgi:hypothetical protein
MAFIAAGLGLLAVGALAGAAVGHQSGPYVHYPRYSPTFNPYYCPAYSYPMMYMGTGMGANMGMGQGFYPWSPMPSFQPSTFGYWQTARGGPLNIAVSEWYFHRREYPWVSIG